MDGIGTGSLVIVNCGNPREKMWGAVVQLDPSGAVIRGLDLEAVEDWLRQERSGGEGLIGPSTFFIPMHRVVRIDLDESRGAVKTIAERFFAACGRNVRDVLFNRNGSDE
jgi:hypothetical protein